MNESWIIALAAAAVGGVALVLNLLLLISLRRVRRERAVSDAALKTIRKDLRALCNAAVTVGERINRAEKQLRQLTDRQEELGMRQEQMGRGDPEAQSYHHAIKMAHKGAGVDELMDVCELTRGEAELIAMMHRLEQTG